MKVVIDIPEDLKKMIFDDEVFDIAHSYRLTMCVKNGTPLPEEATNGDMIKAMFPNLVNSNMDLVDAFNNAKSWWNATYKEAEK